MALGKKTKQKDYRAYQYSPTYQRWREARVAGDPDRAEKEALAHEAQFGYTRPKGRDKRTRNG
jgi:hypothetical protein